MARGARLFERRCLACHRVGERGTAYGPQLTDYLFSRWIRGALLTPDAPEYYGKAKIGGMEAQELDEASLALLLDLLHALRDLPPEARQLPPALESAGRISRARAAASATRSGAAPTGWDRRWPATARPPGWAACSTIRRLLNTLERRTRWCSPERN